MYYAWIQNADTSGSTFTDSTEAGTYISAYAALSVIDSIISLLFVKNVSGFYRQIQEAKAFQEGLKREIAEA